MFPSVTKALATVFAVAAMHIEAEAATIQACGAESTKSGQTLRVNGSDITVHAEPNPKSEKLINQKSICLTCAIGYASHWPRNSKNLLLDSLILKKERLKCSPPWQKPSQRCLP